MNHSLTWLSEFQSAIAARQSEFVETLKQWVEIESPSGDVERLNRLSAQIGRQWETLGEITVETVANSQAGNHLLIRWNPPNSNQQLKPWLVVGHFDTVWPVGTLEKMPFRQEGDRIFGPGTYDMKADLALAWFTVDQMQRMNIAPQRPVCFLWTSDEEVGSRSSREIIENEARKSHSALVLEPPLSNGALKTSRKGVGSYRLDVKGRAAHAGVEPEKGRSAIVELAHQLLKLQSIARPELGTSLNAGQVGGGTANNVVPEKAWAEIDARVSLLEEASRLDAEMRSMLIPVTADVQVAVSGGLNRPPMVRKEGTIKLFQQAREIAKMLGIDLKEGGTGGGSDGNFTSAAGCPTLDGLGLEGAGAHAPHEQIELKSLPFRAVLLAGMLASDVKV